MVNRKHVGAVAIALLLTAPALGQDNRGREPQVKERTNTGSGERQRSRPDWRRSMNAGFLEQEPRVGQSVPDVAVYDADGNKVRLRDVLRGHYSVLVFGCLT